MTLLEMLAGLTVAGMALASGYAAFASLADHERRTRQLLDVDTRVAVQRQLLLDWLLGARLDVNDPRVQFRGLDGVRDDQPDDEITFFTTAPSLMGATETVVRLYVDRDTLTVERGLVAEVSRPGLGHVRRIQLEPGVAGLDVRYLTRMLGKSEWLPSWISSTVMPAAVELTFTPAPGDTLPALLRLPLSAPVGTAR
jgi:hypothetical protein